MRQRKTILYLATAALLFLGYLYFGVTREFTTALDVGFVIVVWVFVFIAMKTGLVKVPPHVRLPGTNLRAVFKFSSLFRAIACAALAIAWTTFAGRVLLGSRFNDTWVGVVFAFGPFLGLVSLFVHYLVDGFKVKVNRHYD